MNFLIAIIACFGHVAICIAAINRMHGVGLRRITLRFCDVVWYSFALGTPLGIAKLYLSGGWETSRFAWLATLYIATASCAAIVAVAFRFHLASQLKKPTGIAFEQPYGIHLNQRQYWSQTDRRFRHRLLASIPGNQILDLSIHSKKVCLPRLDPALDGLTITHLTDLHFTGQLNKEFFAEVVRQANQMDGDMVVLTGDIIDKRQCFDWIPEILSELQSRLGVYFVLGNHDKRVHDEVRVRQLLTDAGLIDMGGGTIKLIEHAGRPIVLGGNELPWHGPASDMASAPTEHNGFRPLRIVLTHTPDKLPWARNTMPT